MAEIYFTKEHEWVKIKDGVASVGISEHAAHELGDITFVELPQVGKAVKQFEKDQKPTAMSTGDLGDNYYELVLVKAESLQELIGQFQCPC